MKSDILVRISLATHRKEPSNFAAVNFYMQKNMENQKIISKAEAMASTVKTAYIGSVGEDGYPYVKGMEIRGHKGLTFYFSTAVSTLRVEQYMRQSKASLYIHRGFKGVMLLGRMDVVDDAESRRVVWHEGDEFYYPQGFDDPTFKVLRFTPERGRLNDSKGTHDFVIG